MSFFKNGGLTELYKDTADRLLVFMINDIKQESAATTTTKTEKVYNLSDNM